MGRARLRTYLLVSLASVTATPLVGLGLVEVGRWREAGRRDADKELASTAEALARAIGQSVDANVRALETSAGELEAHQSLDRPVLQRIVEIHRQRFPGLALVNIADADGVTVASDPINDATRGSYIGRGYADRGYYQDMIRTGRTGISEVEIGKVSGKPAIHAKTPIRALTGPHAGQLVGSMGFGLALGHLQKLTDDIVAPFEGIEARVLDHRMQVVTESDTHGRAVLRDLSAVALFRAPPDAGVRMDDGIDEHGTRVRAALARITEQALGWTVAVTRSHASIEARAAHARVIALGVLIAALVGGLALALALSFWLARPITELEAYAARVRAGEAAPAPRASRSQPREVTTLIDTVESMVGQLQSRNRELEGFRATLEERIRVRTAELNERTVEMRLLLDNLTEGVFTTDRAGVVGSEHSAVLERWFGSPRAGEPFYDYLGRGSAEFRQNAEVAWEQVVEGVLGPEVALGQMPRRLEAGGRHFTLSYRAIAHGADAAPAEARFLVVVSDITSDVERERMLLERRERQALFEHVLDDRTGLLTFIDEASATLARALAPDAPEDVLRRDLHTLKGNSLSFGIESVGNLCHAIESAMNEPGAPWRADLVQLGERWARLTADIDHLLGDRRRVVEMSLEQHAALEGAVRAGAPRAELLETIRALPLDPVERRLRRLAQQATEIASRLGKPITVALDHDDTRLDADRWSPLWGALVHALRNAIDHGIEPAADRLAAGKPATGRIDLRARRSGDALVVEVEDDGRGIDWQALRRNGRDDGGNPLELLFRDGVSSAGQVTRISGRGVGMGALRAAVVALGGTVAVHSTRGAGTRLTMTFATTAAAAA